MYDDALQPGFKCRFNPRGLLPRFTYLGTKCQSEVIGEHAKPRFYLLFSDQHFAHTQKKMFLQPTKKKCVSYLHKTNVRDDLRSKNKCLAHVFVLAKNVIAVPLCAGGWGERDQ